MTKSRGILTPRRRWPPGDLELLRQTYPDMSTSAIAQVLGCSVQVVHTKAASLGLKKSEAFLASEHSGRILRGQSDPRVRATQFRPGDKPWNTGTKGVVGVQEGCRATQFQKGQRKGAAASNWVPIGSYRVNGDGYLDQKVADKGHGRWNWKPVHRLVWERDVGPIPENHMVIFKPGRRTAVLELITVDILECITRAENARRNHPRNRSPEYWKLVQLKGAIRRQVNRIAREANGEQA